MARKKSGTICCKTLKMSLTISELYTLKNKLQKQNFKTSNSSIETSLLTKAFMIFKSSANV